MWGCHQIPVIGLFTLGDDSTDELILAQIHRCISGRRVGGSASSEEGLALGAAGGRAEEEMGCAGV